MKQQEMEIISVGNELLIGKTMNTNAHWLAKRATSFGMMVKRITVITDDTNEIVKAVREALLRKPRFIITTGGLGPTFDDKTLSGIAKALHRKVKVNKEALAMVKAKYEAYAKAGRIDNVKLTAPRLKMARLPEGAEPLTNPVGTAPGAMLKLDDVVLIALPGVPSEMETIFEGSVAPMLRETAGRVVFYEKSIYADGIMESTLAPLIDQTMKDNPYVYMKSHPRGQEQKPHLEIHFSTTAKQSKDAIDRVERAVTQISELIRKKSAKVRLTSID